MKDIYGMTHQDLETYFLELGEKKFKATQIYEWLYDKRVTSISEFSNIKKEIRDKLNEDFVIKLPTIPKSHIPIIAIKINNNPCNSI